MYIAIVESYQIRLKNTKIMITRRGRNDYGLFTSACKNGSLTWSRLGCRAKSHLGLSNEEYMPSLPP